MEPRGQLGLVGGFGHLPAHHVLVELLAADGQLVGALLQGLVDPYQMAEELALLLQVATEHPEGQATEDAHHLPSDARRRRPPGRIRPGVPSGGGGIRATLDCVPVGCACPG